MQNVKLLNGMFKDSQDKGKEYLLYLDIDRLVAPCYEAVSRAPKSNVMVGGNQRELADILLVTGFQLLLKCMLLQKMKS